MPTANACSLLQQLCADLRLLRDQAGGPSLRGLAERLKVSKSQVGAILGGQIRLPPDWRVMRGMLDSILRHAQEHDRTERLSLPTGIDEYWRHQYAIVEHAFVQPRRRGATSSDDATVAVPGTEPVVTRQLPRAIGGFAGRAAELSELSSLIERPTGTEAAVAVIEGPAGVGKTTLMLEWAHRVVDRFPEVQLYVNLRGFDPDDRVMASAEAVDGFLEALGVRPERVPLSLDAKAALYRSTLAGRRALVLLDNAHDAEQVRPLLPGNPGTMTVVTSRNHLTPLVAVDGAHRVPLGLMSHAEARELLAQRLSASQLAAEPESVDRIVSACARLPLALAIVAARARTGLPLAAFAAERADAGDLLDTLNAGDSSSHVRSVFSWSYRTLTPATAQLFRLLGLHPGPDISAPAVASLAGRGLPETRRLLTELVHANLLAEHTPGRYSFHRLLRAYATDLTTTYDPQPERHAATTRLLHHYLHSTHAAERLLHRHPEPAEPPLPVPVPGTAPEELTNHAEAMAWLRVEHSCLLAVLHHAIQAGFRAEVLHLAWAMDSLLKSQGHWDARIAVWQAVLDAARRLDDPGAQALTRRHLADASAVSVRVAEHRDLTKCY